MKTLNKGLLIVFEGIDGTGKSTVAKEVYNRLKIQFDTVFLQEPSDSRWGRKIKEIAVKKNVELTPEEELELFVKDRKEDVRNNILPALKSNKVVILDRYYLSSAAYQGGKGLDPFKIKENNETFSPVPDLFLLFDCPVEVSLKRIASNRGNRFSYFEKQEYLLKVQKIYNSFKDENIRKIDASKSLKEVIEQTYDLIVGFIKSVN